MALSQPLDEIIRWSDSPAGPQRKIAELPGDCFASIEQRDGAYYAMIGCPDGTSRTVITDVFARPGSAQAWVEDKALLLAKGLPIQPECYRERGE